MRVRTFLGIVAALVFVIVVSYLSNQNTDLLRRSFAVTAGTSVPLYVVLLVVFLAGFLPAVSVLLVQTLKRDLAQRRERRMSREAKSLRGSFRRAVDFQADGQWGKAAIEFEALLADRAEDFPTLLRYGEVLRRRGRGEEALEVHRRASVLYPQSVSILHQLADDYEVIGQPEVAQQIRDRILRDFPDVGLQVLRRRRNAALGARRWKEAGHLQGRIEAMLGEEGDSPLLEREQGVRRGLAYQAGVDLLATERGLEAESAFREILADESGFIPAIIMLGEALLLQGDDDRAVAVWAEGFERTGSPVLLQRIEDHFIERERPQGAIETLHGLIAAAENDLLPRFFLGRLYYRLEMHDEALKVLEGLRERVHSSTSYHYLLGRIRQRRGEMAKAVESYLTSIDQAGIVRSEFVCRVCRSKYEAWCDRCEVCGSWNAVEIDFEEEKLSLEELGVRSAPVWPVTEKLEGD